MRSGTPKAGADAITASSRIQWVTADIVSYIPQQQTHLVVSSLFTHHLAERQIIERAQAGQQGCAMSFGPGLTAETMVFHAA